MGLVRKLGDLMIGKRDSREKLIEALLGRSIEEQSKNYHLSKVYLKQAIRIENEIEKDRGRIYFIKYPEMKNNINFLTTKILKYEN